MAMFNRKRRRTTVAVTAAALLLAATDPLKGAAAQSTTSTTAPPDTRAPADLDVGLLLSDGAFTPLPDVPGAAETVHLRMNNRGHIVGTYSITPGTVEDPGRLLGFVLRDGVFTTIDVPGSAGTVALGINDRGQVVGGYVEPGTPPNPVTGETPTRGFLWDSGAFTLIDGPGATATAPYEINNRGQIAGHYSDAGGVQHGFILERGVLTIVDHPNATRLPDLTATRFVGINDAGAIVGSYGDDAGILRAFVRDARGDFTTIGTPGVQAEASAVNNRGQIVGRYLDPRPKLLSFLRDGRGLVTIDALGRCDTAAFDINDRGQILIAPTGSTDGTTCPQDAMGSAPPGGQ